MRQPLFMKLLRQAARSAAKGNSTGQFVLGSIGIAYYPVSKTYNYWFAGVKVTKKALIAMLSEKV